MNIALLGYGRMGHTIERLAVAAGHTVVVTIDVGEEEEKFSSPEFARAHVAIDFSAPTAAYSLCRRALQAGKPVVSGTTGWEDQRAELIRLVQASGGTFFYASNFSIGVNLFFALNRYLAGAMQRFMPPYRPTLEEAHHIHKLDAPSGTACTLAQDLVAAVPQIQGYRLVGAEETLAPDTLPVTAIREGEEVGRHSVRYTSPQDYIQITHQAFSREGFAAGAVMAAEYCLNHSGILSMQQMLGLDQ